jgi:hypothetical protein
LLTGVAKIVREDPINAPRTWVVEHLNDSTAELNPCTQNGFFMFLSEDRYGRIPASCPYAFATLLHTDRTSWELYRFER